MIDTEPTRYVVTIVETYWVDADDELEAVQAAKDRGGAMADTVDITVKLAPKTKARR